MPHPIRRIGRSSQGRLVVWRQELECWGIVALPGQTRRTRWADYQFFVRLRSVSWNLLLSARNGKGQAF